MACLFKMTAGWCAVQEAQQAPAPVCLGAEAAHGALDGEQLAGDAVPGPVDLAQGRPADDRLEGEVVLKGEQVGRHHRGCAPHVGGCRGHQHLEAS